MNRKSFLKTLFTGLVAVKVALEFGAKTLEMPKRKTLALEQVVEFMKAEQARMVAQWEEYTLKPSPWLKLVDEGLFTGDTAR